MTQRLVRATRTEIRLNAFTNVWNVITSIATYSAAYRSAHPPALLVLSRQHGKTDLAFASDAGYSQPATARSRAASRKSVMTKS